MTLSSDNRFEDFFKDGTYIALKNHLYNYRLRKRAVGRCIQRGEKGRILEVGSGLSPMVDDTDEVVYSDLSLPALRTLMKQEKGFFVTADAMHLPFKKESFPWVICSEVLEHILDDRSAIQEMAAVMKQGGTLILTFPHRRAFFTRDDRFVNHLRRYELNEMEDRLREAGLNPVAVQKVLGPLEKITMYLVVSAITFVQRLRQGKNDEANPPRMLNTIMPFFRCINHLIYLPIWLDARFAPRFLSSVLLVRAVKI